MLLKEPRGLPGPLVTKAMLGEWRTLSCSSSNERQSSTWWVWYWKRPWVPLAVNLMMGTSLFLFAPGSLASELWGLKCPWFLGLVYSLGGGT